MLWDDLCQDLVLALGQFDKGANTVNVGINLNVQHVVPPCGNSTSLWTSGTCWPFQWHFALYDLSLYNDCLVSSGVDSSGFVGNFKVKRWPICILHHRISSRKLHTPVVSFSACITLKLWKWAHKVTSCSLPVSQQSKRWRSLLPGLQTCDNI